MRLRTLGIALLAALVLAACGGASAGTTAPAPTSAPAAAAGGIEIVDPWARATAMNMDSPTPSGAAMSGMGGMGGTNGAAYMTLKNSGTADKLVKAESDVAGTVELHTVEMVEGVMKMRPVEGGIDIPANGEQVLKPGGFHIMLIGLKQELKPGEKIALKLQFERAGTVDVQAEVRAQ